MPTSDYIAIAAVIIATLTGWPRIAGLFKKPALKVVAAQRCYVQHYCGRPQALLFMDIQNSGGRSTTIDSINAVLRQGARSWKLSAQSYVADDLAGRIAQLVGQNRELLIGSVTLKPDEHWRGTVDAYDYPVESDEKRFNELVVQMQEDIDAKKQVAPQPVPSESAPLIDVDPALVKVVTDYFNSNFGLAAGPYQLFVTVSFEGGRQLCVKGYSFTIYDAHEKDMRDIADSYRYGIYYAHSRGAKLPIRLTAMDDAQAQAEYGRIGAPASLVA